MTPEYRWFVILCMAHGADPSNQELVKWAAEEWGRTYCSESTMERMRRFRREFEGHMRKRGFEKDVAHANPSWAKPIRG